MGMVKIVAPTPYSKNVEIAGDDGRKIQGVRKATVTMQVGEVNVAELEIVFASFEGRAEARFLVADPCTGLVKAVKRIEFEDGSVFEGV